MEMEQFTYIKDSSRLYSVATSNTLASAMSPVANFSQDQFTATPFPRWSISHFTERDSILVWRDGRRQTFLTTSWEKKCSSLSDHGKVGEA
jgi:hypothetical protein